MRFPALVLLLAVSTAPTPASAQQPAMQTSIDIDKAIEHGLAPGQRLQRFLEMAAPLFHMFDGDRDGAVTDADRKRSLQMFAAMERAPLIGQFLRADYDGDGVVTREELTKYIAQLTRTAPNQSPDSAAKREQGHANWIAAQLRADTNGDGRIDWNEMVAHAKGATERPRLSFDPAFATMLGFDANRDGKTTLAEFQQALEKRFAAIDADQDDVISKEEFDVFWQKAGRPAPKIAEIQPSFEEKRAAACKLPRASKDAKVILVNAYSALGLSPVAIGSPDEVTTTTKVTIEPGSEPLYVLLFSSQRMIWQFQGATDRVRHAVFYAGPSAGDTQVPAGVTGLPKERVTFASVGQCGHFWVNMNKRYPDLTKQYMQLLTGRPADIVLGFNSIWDLRLPSGQATPADEMLQLRADDGGAESDIGKMRRAFLAVHPGGLATIDPAHVISGQPVRPYEVLPDYAGLHQLVRDGTITLNRSGEFLVHKPMRFPPGLSGALSAKFLVLKGVPTPTGSPGHSTVISEETGQPLCPKGVCIQRN